LTLSQIPAADPLVDVAVLLMLVVDVDELIVDAVLPVLVVVDNMLLNRVVSQAQPLFQRPSQALGKKTEHGVLHHLQLLLQHQRLLNPSSLQLLQPLHLKRHGRACLRRPSLKSKLQSHLL